MRTSLVCGAQVLLVAVIACNGGPVSPADVEDMLTERLETASIVFRFARGDSVDPDWQQRYHDWITNLLSVQLPTKLKYYKYAASNRWTRSRS